MPCSWTPESHLTLPDKATEQGGEGGDDAGKKVKGRKRHMILDCLGFLLAVHVHPADRQRWS